MSLCTIWVILKSHHPFGVPQTSLTNTTVDTQCTSSNVTWDNGSCDIVTCHHVTHYYHMFFTMRCTALLVPASVRGRGDWGRGWLRKWN